MKAFQLLAAAAVLIAPTPVLAQPATPFAGRPYVLCSELSFQVDSELKDIAYLAAKDIGDDSAPRATMRAADRTAHLTAIQANLALMQAQKCPLPDVPISSGVYLSAAMQCQHEEAKCDRATWKYGPRWIGRAKLPPVD